MPSPPGHEETPPHPDGNNINITIILLVIGIVMCTAYIYELCTREQDVVVHRKVLRREHLAGTILVGGENVWECIVCAYVNNNKRKNCVLCGTSIDYFVPSTRLGVTQENDFKDGMVIKPTLGVVTNSNIRARQRALFKRRLNSLSVRMALSQRQRGAARRKLWQRQLSHETGKFRWVRTEVPTDGTNLTELSEGSEESTDESMDKKGPDATARAQENPSFAYVVDYDDQGEAKWMPAHLATVDKDALTSSDSLSLDIMDEDDDIIYSLSRRSNKSISSFDFESIMANDFRVKKQWFLKKLQKRAISLYEGALNLTVTRDDGTLLETSVASLIPLPPEDHCMYLKITFSGEPGLDAGGLLREWFLLVSQELFSAKLGLFIPTQGEDLSYWLNPLSSDENTQHLAYYRFAGVLVGRAIFEGVVMDVHLALPLLKHILQIPISFSDLEFLDEELYRSCLWLKSNTNVDDLALTFSVTLENGKEVELKPGGKDIDVNDTNKQEYLNLVLEYRMFQSIQEQLQAFLNGFYDVIPYSLISVFDYQELELLLCGIPTIDMNDWKANTSIVYIKGREAWGPTSRVVQMKVIEWFWEIVEQFSMEDQARLLQFTTGSSRVPVEGFQGLTSSSGMLHPFTLRLVTIADNGLFPKAHTCFNRLDLPIYHNKEELERYLSLAIQMEITGFGLE